MAHVASLSSRYGCLAWRTACDIRATRCGDVLPSNHHAERVRTHRAPRRGLTRGHLAAEFGVAWPLNQFHPGRDAPATRTPSSASAIRSSMAPPSCDPRVGTSPSRGVLGQRSTRPDSVSTSPRGEGPMYDMYPDWGPASHHPENPRSARTPTRRPGVARPAGQRRRAPGRQLTSAPMTVPPAPQARGHPRRRHRSRGDRRGAEGARGRRAGRRQVRADPLRPRRGALPRHRRGAARLRARRDPRARRHPARRGRRQARRPEPAARHSRARAAAAAALRARPLREPAPLPDLPRRHLAAGRPRARSTSSWSARAPRAPTPATAALSGSAPRRRSRPRSRVNTAYGVERVVRDAFGRAQRRPRRKLTLVHKTNVLVNAGSLWWRMCRRSQRSSPT